MLRALITVVVAAPLAAQQLSWRNLDQFPQPWCRTVFDSVRHRFVTHGDHTVEWTGTEWRRRPTTQTPPPRTRFGLAFDSARARVVLFGGLDEVNGLRDDLWEYDGIDWSQRSAAVRPTARARMAMTYDPVRARTVLYGGDGSPVLPNDAWTWDGSVWQSISTGPLTPMVAASMAFHGPSGNVVLLGSDPGGVGTRTWLWNGLAWSLAPAAPPPVGPQFQLSSDPANGDVHLYGTTDWRLWSWNGATWTPGATGPVARTDYGFTTDDAGTTMLFGGKVSFVDPNVGAEEFALAQTWRHSAGAWQLLADGSPLRIGAFADDPVRQRLVCLSYPSRTAVTPMHEWDGVRWHPFDAPNQPPRYAALCYDLPNGRTFAFGGLAAGIATSAMSTWNGASWTPVTSPVVPPPRYAASMCCDYVRGIIVMHGGRDQANRDLRDTWEWNGAVWQVVAFSGPPPAIGRVMAFDPTHGNSMLVATTSIQVETWLWDGVAWTQANPTSVPPPRLVTSIVFDQLRQRIVLLGGMTFGLPRTDRWSWDGANWNLDGNDIDTPGDWSSAPVAMRDEQLLILGPDLRIGSPQVAATQPRGAGCGGATVPVLEELDAPALGAELTFDVYRGGAGAPVLLGFGVGGASVPIGAGCTVYLPSLDLALLLAAGTTGFATARIAVPAQPSLVGIDVGTQAVTLDATAPLGIALTNAIDLHIGR